MNSHDLAKKKLEITQTLSDSPLGLFMDTSINAPLPFRGMGEIKLIVLGQDPTIQETGYRRNIKTALLLDKPGRLQDYLTQICTGLGLVLHKNVYATNLFKNFFIKPPDQFRKENPRFLDQFAPFWTPLLLEEISAFPHIPVLTLGEPVLNCLMKGTDWVQIRNYWGYAGPARVNDNFQVVMPKENVLGRLVLPFPHIHGLQKVFYQTQIEKYMDFLSTIIS